MVTCTIHTDLVSQLVCQRSLVLPAVLEWTAMIETGTLNKYGQGHGFKVGKLDSSQLLSPLLPPPLLGPHIHP